MSNPLFGKTYQLTFLEAMNWLLQQDKTKFVCANEQYYLLRDTPVTRFMTAILKLWQEWK